MSHEEILNEMLYTMCPEDREGDFSTFVIQTHCTEYTIKAESIPNGKYKILSFAVKDI